MTGATRWLPGSFPLLQDCHLLWLPFQAIHKRILPTRAAWTLACPGFGLFPFRSPLLWESQLISFPVSTEMCHFPTFARHASMDSKRGNPDCSGLGCPIRRSGDPLVCSSLRLIAAYHVLLRLSAPRHPPYTLSNLTALILLPEFHNSVSARRVSLHSDTL